MTFLSYLTLLLFLVCSNVLFVFIVKYVLCILRYIVIIFCVTEKFKHACTRDSHVQRTPAPESFNSTATLVSRSQTVTLAVTVRTTAVERFVLGSPRK